MRLSGLKVNRSGSPGGRSCLVAARRRDLFRLTRVQAEPYHPWAAAGGPRKGHEGKGYSMFDLSRTCARVALAAAVCALCFAALAEDASRRTLPGAKQ